MTTPTDRTPPDAPHDAELPAAAKVSRALVLGIWVGVALLAVFVAALIFWDDILPDAKTERHADVAADDAQLAAARSAIIARASEADAVTFGKVNVNAIGTDPAVCGLVDIDQPQDSLEGEERFVFVDGELTLESEDGSAAVDAKWKDVCEG